MIKKITAFILIFCVAAACCTFTATALTEDVPAKAAVLLDAATGTVLFEKNPHEHRSAASITKVMTLLLVFEALADGKITLQDAVTVSEHAASMGGSQIWLEVGEQMTVEELLKATIIASANDAATALAEYVSGSETEFVAQMNARAAELGMKNTVYKNCNGLDEDGHFTSAYDVALVSAELIKHKDIQKYTLIWQDYLRNGETELTNTNKLVKSYNGITGLKTGTTELAGNCVTATAEREGMALVAVILAGDSGAERFNAAAQLLDHGFANWEIYKPDLKAIDLRPVSVENGMEPEVMPIVPQNESDSILVPKGQSAAIEIDVLLDESVEAPVESDQVVGNVTFSLEGKILKEYKVFASAPVEEISFKRVFGRLWQALLRTC